MSDRADLVELYHRVDVLSADVRFLRNSVIVLGLGILLRWLGAL